MKKFTFKAGNYVEPAAPLSVWGKGCVGKGGKTKNAAIERKNESEKENTKS